MLLVQLLVLCGWLCWDIAFAARSDFLLRSRGGSADAFTQQQQRAMSAFHTLNHEQVVEQAFARFNHHKRPVVFIRGMFSSGTGWLRSLLQLNCKEDIQFHDPTRDPMERNLQIDADGLYGWKHTYFGVYDRARFAKHANHFMIILSRDAFTWAYSTYKMKALVRNPQTFSDFLASPVREGYPTSFVYMQHYYAASKHAGQEFGPNLAADHVFAIRKRVYSNWLGVEQAVAGRVHFQHYEALRENPGREVLHALARFGIRCGSNLTMDTFVNQEFRVKMEKVNANIRVQESNDRRAVCQVLELWPNLYATVLERLDLDFERQVLGYEYAQTWEEYCGYAPANGKNETSKLAFSPFASQTQYLQSILTELQHQVPVKYVLVHSARIVMRAYERFNRIGSSPLILLRGMVSSGAASFRSALRGNYCAPRLQFIDPALSQAEKELGVDADGLYGWQHAKFGEFEQTLFALTFNHYMVVVVRDALTWAHAAFEERELTGAPNNFWSFTLSPFAQQVPRALFLEHYYAVRGHASSVGVDIASHNIFAARAELYANLLREQAKRLRGRIHLVRYEDLQAEPEQTLLDVFTTFSLSPKCGGKGGTGTIHAVNQVKDREAVCQAFYAAPALYQSMLKRLDLDFEHHVLGYTYPGTWEEYCNGSLGVGKNHSSKLDYLQPSRAPSTIASPVFFAVSNASSMDDEEELGENKPVARLQRRSLIGSSSNSASLVRLDPFAEVLPLLVVSGLVIITILSKMGLYSCAIKQSQRSIWG